VRRNATPQHPTPLLSRGPRLTSPSVAPANPTSPHLPDTFLPPSPRLPASYRMDYMRFVQAHIETGADITIGCIPYDESRASDFGLMKIDGLVRAALGQGAGGGLGLGAGGDRSRRARHRPGAEAGA
jgi:hypothetical protein